MCVYACYDQSAGRSLKQYPIQLGIRHGFSFPKSFRIVLGVKKTTFLSELLRLTYIHVFAVILESLTPV